MTGFAVDAFAEEADTTAKESKYEKLFKKEKIAPQKGLVTLHLVEGKLYAEMPLQLLGREFLMGSTIKSISDNNAGIAGSKNMELKHFAFDKIDSTIYMKSLDASVMSPDANIGQALTLSSTGAIIKGFKVEAYSPDSTAVVFEMTDFFLDDNADFSPFLSIGAYKSGYNVDETYKKDLSYISGVKSFSDNISVTVSRSYQFTVSNMAGKALIKKQPLTAEMACSFILLPEKPYHPRKADPRIGLFFTGREKFGTLSSGSKEVYYVNRWRLEPSDTEAFIRGEKVEPTKPIVFYIDNTFPEWWKPYIREAVNSWSGPFEDIGFKNAVIAKDFPTAEEDPEFDPDNIKYNCVRYAPIGVKNAMGPSWVDPRSGEIINASVYVYHDVIKLVSDWMYVQTAQADEAVRGFEPSKERLGEAFLYVIRHEVGHCLGLMHNMGASSSIPVESLRDPAFTQENGTTYSIMDYARFNYIAQPGDMERGVKLTPPDFGKYDRYAIRWAYTPVFGAADFEEESRITTSWISDSLKVAPFYRYGKQQVYSMFFDPRNQNEDLGDDVIAASKYGMSNLKYIMKNFMDWIGPEDDEYELRTDIYVGIINQYLRYAQHVLMNVGGLYRDEVREGDPYKAFENIPREKQIACLDYLFQLWDDTSWIADKDVISRLPLAGSPEKALRSSLQSLILYTPYFCSLSDGIATKEFSSTECYDYIFDKVFGPTKKGKKLSEDQRSFQRDFITGIMTMGGFKIPGAKSLSLNEDEHWVSLTERFHSPLCCCADCDEEHLGELMYSPISGFEWLPRHIFNSSDVTKASLYAQLTKARKLMKSHMSSANADDKAHYQILVGMIDYSVK